MFSIIKENIEPTVSCSVKDKKQEISDTRTSNLKIDHFNYIGNSKDNKIKKNISQYQPLVQNHSKLGLRNTHSLRNNDEQKSVLQLQNQNLVFMNPQNSESMPERKFNRSFKNKIFTIQPESVLNEESKLVKNPKLSYLKRYVANFSKNGTSQFSDGYWGNHPYIETNKIQLNQSTTTGLNSKFSVNDNSYQTFGNYIPYNANQAKNNQSYKEKELSIIDLQLPIKAICSYAQPNLSRSKKTEPNINEENNVPSSKIKNIEKNMNFKNSQSNSSILIENVDYSNAISRINGYQEVETQADSAVHNNIIPEIDELIKFKTSDRSNNFLNKYLINQQKKKKLINSNNRIYETNFSLKKYAPFKSQALFTGTSMSSNSLGKPSNNEIIVNSNLNTLSSNSLLIKRLKF